MRFPRTRTRERFIMKCRRSGRIHGKAELIVPTEFKARRTDRQIAQIRPGDTAGKVRRMCGNFEGCHAFAHVGFIGQPQMLLGRHITKHGSARSPDDRAANGCRDVVIAGSHIGDQRPERIKRRIVAPDLFELLIEPDTRNGDMSRPFNHDLHARFGRSAIEFSQGFEFGELRRIGAVMGRA